MSDLTTRRVLHVEDDPMQQRLLTHHLQSMQEFRFEITAMKSEEEAMAAFRTVRFDLVVLDYQLSQGNGLHLLWRVRQVDPVVPIIAISGVATSEVAAELVRAGADDYFDKRELTSAKLALSVRAALLRTETVRKRTMQHSAGVTPSQMTYQLVEVSQYFTEKVGPELVQKLDDLERAARQAGMSAEDLEPLYVSACSQMKITSSLQSLPSRQVVRLLMLELVVRFSGESMAHDFDQATHGP